MSPWLIMIVRTLRFQKEILDLSQQDLAIGLDCRWSQISESTMISSTGKQGWAREVEYCTWGVVTSTSDSLRREECIPAMCLGAGGESQISYLSHMSLGSLIHRFVQKLLESLNAWKCHNEAVLPKLCIKFWSLYPSNVSHFIESSQPTKHASHTEVVTTIVDSA